MNSSSDTHGDEFAASPQWLLEGCLPDHESISRTPLKTFPFCAGRNSACELQVASPNVSKRHATLQLVDDKLIVEDLGSTNGTFVNGRSISQPTFVNHGDLIQLADVEFRLLLSSEIVPEVECTNINYQPEQSWTISRMHEVLNEGRMTIFFQPIVTSVSREVFGYEALVRTDVPGLESPIALFDAASRLGLEIRLSQACRTEAIKTLEASGVPGALFLNTHCHERLGPELIESMREIRQQAGDRTLVLEIHEEAVTDVDSLRDFAVALRRLDIKLAFDDFGVGQSRLLELSQVSPDYLKFDRSLVKDLRQGAAQTGLVANLHRTAIELGITTLAEGLETPESIAACDEIGFTHYQGFAFGRPQPIANFLSHSLEEG
ncbi:EAL domain-containing protein [Blastopirellula sp. J2-11]|uniref:EAL domain-containing protein n=1 Tax=Blastopirellula sp. J2-11 TaxID=2943192 RepID=UPI0021C9EFFC|nr:EAL domain-containing protein [Blastopirellula sp. J2-11]UUO08859.1 EAL domain-containing protein [Blastopirellula sp. J2-11]